MKKTYYKKRKGIQYIRSLVSIVLISFFPLLILFILYFLYFYFLNHDLLESPLPQDKKAEKKHILGKVTIEDIENSLKREGLSLSSITASSSSYIVVLRSSEEVWFSDKKDARLQTSSLQLILSRFTIEGKKVKRIDFRFDKPLIEFQ